MLFLFFIVCVYVCCVHVLTEVCAYVYAFEAMGLESSWIALYLTNFFSIYSLYIMMG